jgi:hypothetical protein
LLGWNAPYYESAIPDDFNPVLLAALAHELGHVKWYETFVSSPGGPHNFRQFCDGNFFDAWRGGWSVVHVPPKWRELLTPAGRRRPNAVQDTHKDPPQTADIDRAIADNNFDGNSGAGALLDQIYKPDAPWANFFASTAPDEDFVETYKLKVLVNADNRLQSLQLVIPTNPSYRKNVGDKIDNGLAVKLQCFRT